MIKMSEESVRTDAIMHRIEPFLKYFDTKSAVLNVLSILMEYDLAPVDLWKLIEEIRDDRPSKAE